MTSRGSCACVDRVPGRIEVPSIDLVLGYHKANNAPPLKTFLSRVDDMIGHVLRRA